MNNLRCRQCGNEIFNESLSKNNLCNVCRQKNCIERIRSTLLVLPYNVDERNYLYLMDVDVTDYKEIINTHRYVLIKIEENILDLIREILEIIDLDIKDEIVNNAKFMFITDELLDLERVECHLHNRFSTSCDFSRPVICGIKLKYDDWAFRYKPIEKTLNVIIEGINEISELVLDSTSIALSQIDIEYIIDKLDKLKDSCIYRGINRHYYRNDGIAASIYRNNHDLVKYGKLQEHEKEVVDNLLSKQFYRPSCAKENDVKRSTISALTDLRHSGKDTCLLDFTKNSKIAIYFSCQPSGDNSATVGEILILSKEEFEYQNDITYPNKSNFLIDPAITEITKYRVKAQKSIFLYCYKGYLPRDSQENRVQNILIASSLKSTLYQYCGYNAEMIYPDFASFIDNPENFKTLAKKHCQQEGKMQSNYV